MKEFRVMYVNRGHSIPAMQSWFPTEDLAMKALAKLRTKSLWRNEKLFLEERAREGAELPPCTMYRGKPVYSPEWYFSDALEPGDYVAEDVVDSLMNAMPPACMRGDCSQLGEPYSFRIDEDGNTRNTYWTFKRIAECVWEFCGDCFRGENVQRGETPAYI